MPRPSWRHWPRIRCPHLEQVATATTPVGQVEAALSGDFSGDDLDLTIQLTTAREGVDMDMVIVGDTAYVRAARRRGLDVGAA